MNKDYKISNDGTIFEIKDDGSISKLAKIDNQGRVTDLSGTVLSANGGGNKGVYWFFIIVFVIAIIILAVLYSEANNSYYWANYERNEYREKYENVSSSISSLRNENNSLKQERDKAKSELSKLKNKVGSTYPLIITDIEMANIYSDGTIQTNYGYMIYSYNTMYLKPRIKYAGLVSGTKTFKIKLYKPDGSLSTGTYSTYTYSDDVYIYEGENTCTFSGWGNSNRGNWRSGTYRIEIWYENTCLKSKTFTIY